MLFASAQLQAQIQFQQVPAPLPAPQNIADFDGIYFSSIAFADVDGDGDQDVLITGLNDFIEPSAKLYTNNGSGGYTLLSGTPFDRVGYGSIAFADVDGDADQDVLITGQNSSNQRIAKLYTNNGSGSYSLISAASFDGVYFSSVAFADVDGDGDQDVLITGRNSSNQRIAKLYTNNGSGGYSLVGGTPFEGVQDGSIAFADVDGDGDQDVLITGQNSTNQRIAKLYTNNGSGSFSLVSVAPFDGVYFSSIAFADVDGDGDQDVLITGLNSSNQSTAKLYYNNGSGGYSLLGGTPFDGVSKSSISFADVDGDGDQDVLVTGFDSTNQPIAKLYTNNGSGGYSIVSGTPFDGVFSGSIAFTDVDADGDQDVLITGGNSNVAVAKLYTNNGSEGYSLVSGTPFDGVREGSIAFADVDGDGDQDVLITGQNNSFQRIAKLYTNDGTGNYTPVIGTPFDGVSKSSIAFADVDGDGDQDVLVTGFDSTNQPIAKLYTNNGSGGYSIVSETPFDGVFSGSIAFADVNGDGDQDVLITGQNSSNQRIAKLYTNNGSGGYSLASGTPFDGVWLSSIAFADVNGDGDQDVLITGLNSLINQSIAKLYTNNGSGGYSLVSGTPFDGVHRSSIAFADVDVDGDQDVLITGLRVSTNQRIAKLYTNNGNGGYSLLSGTSFDGVERSSIAFADIELDGDQDVLITGQNSSNQRIAKLYTNNGSGGYSLVSGTPFDGVNESSISFTDVDGDGDQDVVITGLSGTGQSIAKLYRNITPLPCTITTSCTAYTLTLSPSGTANLQPENVDNGSTSTCGTPILSLSQTEFDWRHLGENTVTLTVTDENGNADTCETTVTVQPPVEGFPLVNVVSVPSEIEVDEGESFSLTIRIEPDSVGQVTAADVAMSFDPALLQVTSVSLAPGTLLNTPTEAATFDNNAGTLFAGGSNVLPANTAFDHVVINFQAIGSGNTTIAHITEGSPATTLSFAGFDVTGTTEPVMVNIGSIITDCAGVPGGSAYFDECGICVGGTTGLDECPQDCYGEYGGTAYFDPCGQCVGGNTGLDECVEDCNGVLGGEAFFDECGNCVGGNTGSEPCVQDCNGDFGGTAYIDECGQCVEGNTELLPCPPDPCRYFLSNHNTQGGSDVYELTINEIANTADMNLLVSVPQRITLSYNHMANLLYLGRENNSTFQTYNPDGGNLGLPIGVNVGLSGFAAATYGPDGMLYAASQTSGAVYRFNPTNFTGSLYSQAQVNGGDIAFTADGELILVSRSPARAFLVNENGPNTILGPVPAGVSGLARRADGTFLLSVQGYDKLITGSTTEGDLGVRFDLKLNGAPFTPANGDLASGCAVPAAAIMVLTDTNLPVHAEEVGAKLASQPNPTEGTSIVTFTTETGTRATLEVYDVSGRSVATLFNAEVQPGQEYRAEFNGAALPNGVYIYRLTTDAEVVIEKFMIAR